MLLYFRVVYQKNKKKNQKTKTKKNINLHEETGGLCTNTAVRWQPANQRTNQLIYLLTNSHNTFFGLLSGFPFGYYRCCRCRCRCRRLLLQRSFYFYTAKVEWCWEYIDCVWDLRVYFALFYFVYFNGFAVDNISVVVGYYCCMLKKLFAYSVSYMFVSVSLKQNIVVIVVVF